MCKYKYWIVVWCGMLLVLFFFITKGHLVVKASEYTNAITAYGNFGKDKKVDTDKKYFYFCTMGKVASASSDKGYASIGWTISFQDKNNKKYAVALKKQLKEGDSGSIQIVNTQKPGDGYEYTLCKVKITYIRDVFFAKYTSTGDKTAIDTQFSGTGTKTFFFNALICLWDKVGSEKVNRVTIEESGIGSVNRTKGSKEDIFTDKEEASAGCKAAGWNVEPSYFKLYFNLQITTTIISDDLPDPVVPPAPVYPPGITIDGYKSYWNASDLENGGIAIHAISADIHKISTVTVECLTTGNNITYQTPFFTGGWGTIYDFVFYPGLIKNGEGEITGETYRGDGTYTFRVTATVIKDYYLGTYVITQKDFTVNMDCTAPVLGGYEGNMQSITGNSMDRGYFKPGTSHTLEANGTDNFSGMANVQLFPYVDYQNGNRVTYPYGHIWNGATLCAQLGVSNTTSVMAVATDKAGNQSIYPFSYYYDNTAPSASGLMLVNDSTSDYTVPPTMWFNDYYCKGYRKRFNYQTQDSQTGISSVRLMDTLTTKASPGVPASTKTTEIGLHNIRAIVDFATPRDEVQSSDFSLENLSDGIHTMRIISTDGVGNQTESTSVTYQQDTNAPYAGYEENSVEKSGNTITKVNFTLDVYDTTSGIKTITFSPQSSGQGFTIRNLQKVDANHWIYSCSIIGDSTLMEITFTDIAGNSSTSMFGKVYKNPYLNVGYGYLLGGQIHNHGDDINWEKLSGSKWNGKTLTETHWLKQDTEIYVSSSAQGTNGTPYMQYTSLYRGEHTFSNLSELTSYGYIGDLLQSSSTLGVDIHSPYFSMFKYNSESAMMVTSHMVSNEGVNSFTAVAVDQESNFTNQTYRVKIDKTAPKFTSVTFSHSVLWSNQDQKVTIVAEDTFKGLGEYRDCSGVSTLKIYKNTMTEANRINDSLITTESSVGTESKYKKTFSYLDTDESAHQLIFVVSDAAGNIRQVTYNINIDKTAPVAEILGGDTWTNQPVTITFHAIEKDKNGVAGSTNCSGIQSFYAIKNYQTISESLTMNTNKKFEKAYSYTMDEEYPMAMIYTTDVAGNISSIEKRIRIDKTQPSATLQADYDSENSIKVDITNATDALSGIRSGFVTYTDVDNCGSMQGQNLESATINFLVTTKAATVEVPLVKNGVYDFSSASAIRIDLVLYDKAGNQMVKSVTVKPRCKLNMSFIHSRDSSMTTNVFKGGEYGLIRLETLGYQDTIKVTLPKQTYADHVVGESGILEFLKTFVTDKTSFLSYEISPNYDKTEEKTYPGTTEVTIHLDPLKYKSIVYLYFKPLLKAEKGTYVINGKSQKGGIQKNEENLTLNIEGTITSEIRTRIRVPE